MTLRSHLFLLAALAETLRNSSELLRSKGDDVPILLQSTDQSAEEAAQSTSWPP